MWHAPPIYQQCTDCQTKMCGLRDFERLIRQNINFQHSLILERSFNMLSNIIECWRRNKSIFQLKTHNKYSTIIWYLKRQWFVLAFCLYSNNLSMSLYVQWPRGSCPLLEDSFCNRDMQDTLLIIVEHAHMWVFAGSLFLTCSGTSRYRNTIFTHGCICWVISI